MNLTNRVKKLREDALNWQETQTPIIGQRLYWALEALESCPANLPWMKRKSRVLANILQKSEPWVQEGELLVGYNYAGSDPGQWLEVVLQPPDEAREKELRAYLAQGPLTQAQIEFILAALKASANRVPGVPFTPERPASIAEAEREGLFWCLGIPENHTILGYASVLEKGFEGIYEEVRRKRDNFRPTSREGWKAIMLADSLLETAAAAAQIGSRYAEKLRRLRQDCADPLRASELEHMERVVRQVPAHPARTFAEAVQSLWFAHIINTWEDGINANSLGRLDQILFPYYQKDLAEGRITRAEAFELLGCLWIKLYRDYDVQQAALGGVNAAGQDATNELTYLMLDVTEALDFVRCLSVRLHKGSPPALLRRSLEIVGKGKGIPFFFNDDVLIPALVENGITCEDARDYAAIGCVEITIPGRANPHAVSNRINLLKCLELALNQGRSMTSGALLGPRSAKPAEMRGIEDVIAAFEQQVESAVARMCQETLRLQLEYSLTKPMPYKSLLTAGCLESGRDFNDQGARYDYHESMPMGIPNVADSLAAIDQVVFQEQKYTLPELVEELRQDYPRETIRQELLKKAPKFGNDDDAVDYLAARVFEHYCRLMQRVSKEFGLAFFAQPFTFLWLVEAGERTAATPDGRRSGENLAYSISPMQGRDYKGLTALVNSLAKLPQKLAAGSTSAIIEVEPSLFSSTSIGYLVTLLETAVEKGVGQLQFNVVSVDTLKKAQAEPEKYRNLAVRVSGFSQRFCLLDRKLQDHIIARTKHNQL